MLILAVDFRDGIVVRAYCVVLRKCGTDIKITRPYKIISWPFNGTFRTSKWLQQTNQKSYTVLLGIHLRSVLPIAYYGGEPLLVIRHLAAMAALAIC